MNNLTQQEVIKNALAEDGSIDWSSCPIQDSQQASAEIWLKESAVIAGLSVAEQVFLTIDKSIQCQRLSNDGAKISLEDDHFVVMKVQGSAKAILRAERVALNFLQHLSGIATKTAFFVDLVRGSAIRIRDTRKTLPGLRALQKQAVLLGGGMNHRMSLEDAVLLKDNHWLFAHKLGLTMQRYVEKIRENAPEGLPLEIEAKTLPEVEAALLAQPSILLLDNMNPSLLDQAVSKIYGQCSIEVSGNITEKTIQHIIHLPIDFIAIGALTHSVRAIDFSLEISEEDDRRCSD